MDYLHLAGQQAVQRSANAEAISHLTAALELLKTLPDTPERAQQELTLQVALGVPLAATKGYATPEVERTYTRARELCQQIGETPQLFLAVAGLWQFSLVRAEHQTARELGEQLLTLAQSAQDPAFFLAAHRALGEALFCLGELTPARVHFEQGIALYDPQQHRSLAFRYGVDPGVYCLSFAAWTLWLLGYVDQALKKSHEALALVQRLSHPPSLMAALAFATQLYKCRREVQPVRERAEATIMLSTEQGSAFWLAWGGMTFRGWALAVQGQEEGIAQIRQGLAAL